MIGLADAFFAWCEVRNLKTVASLGMQRLSHRRTNGVPEAVKDATCVEAVQAGQRIKPAFVRLAGPSKVHELGPMKIPSLERIFFNSLE